MLRLLVECGLVALPFWTASLFLFRRDDRWYPLAWLPNLALALAGAVYSLAVAGRALAPMRGPGGGGEWAFAWISIGLIALTFGCAAIALIRFPVAARRPRRVWWTTAALVLLAVSLPVAAMRLQPSHRIVFQFQGHDGRPLARVPVELTHWSVERLPLLGRRKYERDAQTEADGTVMLDGVRWTQCAATARTETYGLAAVNVHDPEDGTGLLDVQVDIFPGSPQLRFPPRQRYRVERGRPSVVPVKLVAPQPK
jgi:hypothetical protein